MTGCLHLLGRAKAISRLLSDRKCHRCSGPYTSSSLAVNFSCRVSRGDNTRIHFILAEEKAAGSR